MAVNEIHIGDIGTVFELTMKDGDIVVDISTATLLEIKFSKPGPPVTVVTKGASLKTDGTDGVMYYATVADDLDEVGKWKIQAKVTLPTGTWSSDISSFKVYDNL